MLSFSSVPLEEKFFQRIKIYRRNIILAMIYFMFSVTFQLYFN